MSCIRQQWRSIRNCRNRKSALDGQKLSGVQWLALGMLTV